MNVFETVKQSVTTRQAAEHYGIRVGRNGMACCPFHNDKTPSMKLDRRYHCFGCGADGDVIDFTAALYGLGKKEAAVQLARDFGLSYEEGKLPDKMKKPKLDLESYSNLNAGELYSGYLSRLHTSRGLEANLANMMRQEYEV